MLDVALDKIVVADDLELGLSTRTHVVDLDDEAAVFLFLALLGLFFHRLSLLSLAYLKVAVIIVALSQVCPMGLDVDWLVTLSEHIDY